MDHAEPNKMRPKHFIVSWSFVAVHLAALIGVFLVPVTWPAILAFFLSYYVRMFGITGGFHRYFSHRTFKAGRITQFVLAWIGTSSAQKGPLWWAAHHRHHHRYSDLKEDIHSPKQDGFWWSHVGWIMSPKYEGTRWELIQDLAKYPELLWLDRNHVLPSVVLGFGLYFLGGWSVFVWGYLVSTVVLWHATFTINSLSHVYGSRRYESNDTSRNNPWLAFLTMGEGWHNNHHTYQSSTRQGFFWWEIDLTYYILKALSWVGIVRELREPPLAQLEKKRIKPPAESPAPGIELRA
jgi:stearoyl-CoA desaturase (delta-9 desaturase)